MKKQLIHYSAFATAVIGSHQKLLAEAVYYDIDPDTVIDLHVEFYYLDINEDTISDFVFFKVSTYYYDTFYNTTRFKRRIWAGGIGGNNGLAGSSQTFVSGGTRYYPYALPMNAPINNALQFNNWVNQRMAYWSFYTFDFGTAIYSITNFGGNWYPEFEDRFLGIKYQDLEGFNHFGWIRCSVLDSGKVLILKDYAYELAPNTSIKAGDIIGDTTIKSPGAFDTIGWEVVVDIETVLPASTLYSFAKKLYYIISDNAQLVNFQIFDLQGAIVHASDTYNTSGALDLSYLPSGVYIVKAVINNTEIVKKIHL
jgi:hypothetical protein